MKMEVKTWITAQFNCDYEVTVRKTLRLPVLIHLAYGVGAPEDYRAKLCSVSSDLLFQRVCSHILSMCLNCTMLIDLMTQFCLL